MPLFFDTQYPIVSLAHAHKARDDARLMLNDGKNPYQVRKDKKIEASIQYTNTLGLVSQEYITDILKARSDGDVNKIRRTIQPMLFAVRSLAQTLSTQGH